MILSSFKLLDNHLDHLARVTNPPVKTFLHELFPPDTRFKKNMVEVGRKFKALSALADEVVDQQETAAIQAAENVVEADCRVTEAAKQKRRNDNLEKARDQLKKTKVERASRRCLDLSSFPTPAPLADAAEAEPAEAVTTS